MEEMGLHITTVWFGQEVLPQQAHVLGGSSPVCDVLKKKLDSEGAKVMDQ